MNMNEHIRIGMPVFNGEPHLVEAFESLLNQTYENFEIFVVDNASTDGTQDIAQAYAKKDSRIKYFRQPEWVNATANWNRTYAPAAHGVRFFMWASDDDLWAKDYIESLLPPLIQNPKIVLSFSQADEIDMEGRTIGELYRKSFPEGNTGFRRIRSIIRDGKYSAIYGLIRTDAVRWIPCLYDTSFGSDLWFLIRLATSGDFHMIRRTLFFKRMGGICESGMDPSASHDPLETWNIEEQEWKLISQLDLSWLVKIYIFLRLKVSAKILYPRHKKINPLLLPAVYFLMLRENPHCFGLRCRLKRYLSILAKSSDRG
jgi:glycosyltransferase involved in cell wall biosynthesis